MSSTDSRQRALDSSFYVTGGTPRQDAPCYVERRSWGNNPLREDRIDPAKVPFVECHHLVNVGPGRSLQDQRVVCCTPADSQLSQMVNQRHVVLLGGRHDLEASEDVALDQLPRPGGSDTRSSGQAGEDRINFSQRMSGDQ